MSSDNPDPPASGFLSKNWRNALIVPAAIVVSWPVSATTSADWYQSFSISLAIFSLSELVLPRLLGEQPEPQDWSKGGPSEVPREAVSGFAAAMLILAIVLGLIAFLRG